MFEDPTQEPPGTLAIDWLGVRYLLTNPGRALTVNERKLLQSVGNVLNARYELVFNSEHAPRTHALFRGLPEDRYVSAFLDPLPYSDLASLFAMPDRISDAIEVLRISALTTYENRRIVTGVLIFGAMPDPCHVPPSQPEGALPYSTALTTIRSFHRLCDGLQTLALVNREGLLVELVDVQEWTEPYSGFELPVPSPARYEPHCRATLCGGHTCLVLTPNGEIKIFSEGTQVFNFIDGRWRLTDSVEKYLAWEDALGDRKQAERLFKVALNLAEERRGSLFVVLNQAESVDLLVARGDLLNAPPPTRRSEGSSKAQLHYLLRGKTLNEIPHTVLESVARIDGGIVLDRSFRLLAFGAILRHQAPSEGPEGLAEGGRTTAAISASRLGNVLKVSEDGLVSFYRNGRVVWQM